MAEGNFGAWSKWFYPHLMNNGGYKERFNPTLSGSSTAKQNIDPLIVNYRRIEFELKYARPSNGEARWRGFANRNGAGNYFLGKSTILDVAIGKEEGNTYLMRFRGELYEDAEDGKWNALSILVATTNGQYVVEISGMEKRTLVNTLDQAVAAIAEVLAENLPKL